MRENLAASFFCCDAQCSQVFGQKHLLGQWEKMALLVVKVLANGLDEFAKLLPRFA